MKNSKAYYKLTSKRLELEEEFDIIKSDIEIKRTEAKKFPKGSEERKRLMQEIQDLGKTPKYQQLNSEIKMLNFCINTVFYS